MWSMRRAGIVCVAVGLCAAGGEAAAQRGVVAGRVVDDSSGVAVAGAEVQLLAADKRVLHTTVVAADGAFAFAVRRRGEYRLRASTDGFREVITPRVSVGRRDSVGLELRLRQGVVRMAPLEVIARPARRRSPPGLDRFRDRLESSVNGRFITRDQLRARGPVRLTDMLPQAGVTVTSGLVYFRRAVCPPMVYMDGVQMTRPQGRPFHVMGGQGAFEVINLISPSDVEGIEVYPGRSSTPAEFGGPGAECGVIAIWTRRHEPKG